MAVCVVDGKAVIPGPLPSWSREYQLADDGTPVGVGWSLTLRGKLVADRGSPTSSGTFWTGPGEPPGESIAADSRLASLFRKQEALRSLFSVPGRLVEFTPWDGSTPISCNPTVGRIEFAEGTWVDTCDYTITLSTQELRGLGSSEDAALNQYPVSKASDEWSMDRADEYGRTYRLTHTVSAVGKRVFDETGAVTAPAWENARNYVLNRVGLGLVPARLEASGVLNASSLQAFNYVRGVTQDNLGGTYRVSEQWTCAETSAVEEYTVEKNTDDSGRTRVSIQGTITGLEQRNNSTYTTVIATRYANALTYYNSIAGSLHARAQTYSGLTLHGTALSVRESHNVANGVISYSRDYDDRASHLVTGTLSESLQVNEQLAADVVAQIPVLGRAAGPVLQSVQTVSARKKSVSYECSLGAKTQSYTPEEPTDAVNTLLLTFQPSGSSVYVEDTGLTWNPLTGRYTRSVSWIYTP